MGLLVLAPDPAKNVAHASWVTMLKGKSCGLLCNFQTPGEMKNMSNMLGRRNHRTNQIRITALPSSISIRRANSPAWAELESAISSSFPAFCACCKYHLQRDKDNHNPCREKYTVATLAGRLWSLKAKGIGVRDEQRQLRKTGKHSCTNLKLGCHILIQGAPHLRLPCSSYAESPHSLRHCKECSTS